MAENIFEKIEKLKKQRNAVILAHNYQDGDIQDLADYCGDSLGLSVTASKTEADVIVFCGVLFMAETAAILSPDKTVLLPDEYAGCPMADMITGKQLVELKNEHPGAIVVCYVNSSAEVKAESDYCCTSSNAFEVVFSLPKDAEVLFVPDQHLGRYVAEKTGRNVVLWPGYCPTHIRMDPEDLKEAKAKYPDAVVLAHPECSEAITAQADELLSTGQMLAFAGKSSEKQFIIATETGIIHTLKKQNPGKEFIAASENAVCRNMKKITLDKVLDSLEKMRYVVTVPEDVSKRARRSLERMIEILPGK